MPDPVYTKLELIAATGGKRHRDAQERVLRELGVHFKVVGGKLLVSRQHDGALRRIAADGVGRMSDGCMCEWPKTCDGMGSVSCRGCGGDLCVCICGGESECYGCEDCFGADDDDYPDDNPTDLANVP